MLFHTCSGTSWEWGWDRTSAELRQSEGSPGTGVWPLTLPGEPEGQQMAMNSKPALLSPGTGVWPLTLPDETEEQTAMNNKSASQFGKESKIQAKQESLTPSLLKRLILTFYHITPIWTLDDDDDDGQ